MRGSRTLFTASANFLPIPLLCEIAQHTGAPIVHTYHTLYEQYSRYVIHSQALGSRLVPRLVKWRLRSASDVIVPTEKVAHILTGYQIDKPIHVVPTGLDLTRFERRITPERRMRLRARYGMEDKDFVLIYIGRLGAEKSIDRLLTLLSKTLITQPDVKLLLVGDGPERNRLEEEAIRLNVWDHVAFTGMVAPEEVSEYYQLGDVFVSASTSETQGLTYVEAAASGLPLICADDPCLDGVLRSGINGAVFDTAEAFVSAVCQMKNDSEYRWRAGLCSRSMAAKFSKQVFAASAEDVYASVCEVQKVQGGGERPHDYDNAF